MIIVTGAAGLIGAALLSQFAKRNIDIIPVTREACDLTVVDLVDFIPTVTKDTPSIIVHLAANIPFANTQIAELKAYEETTQIDANVYHAAKAWGAKVIYASTLSLYDKSKEGPYFEDAQLGGFKSWSYLHAKSVGEDIFLSNSNNVVLRLPAPIGERLQVGTVASLFVEKARNNETLEVWGDGQREQNYVCTNDIGLAFIKSINPGASGIFNIASPDPITMRDLACMVVKICKKGRVELVGKEDPNDHQRASFGCDKARFELDWEPLESFESSLRRAIRNYVYQ